MTLFFPDNGGPENNVKIAASNSQVGLTVGDTMTITAGNSFTIGGGSTSAIKIGPTTNFSIGSTIDLKLSSTISYTYGFKAEYGAATAATSTSTKVKATDSYTIQAGVYTPVTQKIIWAEKYQVFAVLVGTVISMTAIAFAVLGSLSNPMFVAVPGAKSTDSAALNSSSSAVASSACALAITTTGVFIAQWALTYMLAKSSEFSPVTSMVFNSSGITATANTKKSYDANTLINTANKATEKSNVALVAAGSPAVALIPVVPSIESIMFASQTTDDPMLTHRVNKAPINNLAPQLSEVILTNDSIALNTTTKPGGVATHNTQITMDSASQTISLLSDSAPAVKGGSITISKDTAISNPAGMTRISSNSTRGGSSVLQLQQGTQATLTCTGSASSGSLVATANKVSVGVGPVGGNIAFTSSGSTLSGATLTLSGTNINIGGAITVIGGAVTQNSSLGASIQQLIAKNITLQNALDASNIAANLRIAALEETAQLALQAAQEATNLNRSLESKMSKFKPKR